MGVVAYPAFLLQDLQDTGVCSNFILNSLTFIFLCFWVWLFMEMSLKQRFLTKHYEIEPQHIQTKLLNYSETGYRKTSTAWPTT